jgi:erythromycin esterase-like protein
VTLEQWLDARAVRLDPATYAPHDVDAERLAAIDRALDGVRCVFVGEANHFVHEKSDYRAWWLRRLAARHRLVVGEELGCIDGRRVAAYLADGDETHFTSLATFGDERHRRTDRDDRPTGILRASFDVYPAALFKAEQARFYRTLRELGVTRFHGLDIDAPGNGYSELHAWRGRRDIDPAFWTLVARVDGETLDEEAHRLQRALERLPNEPPTDDLREIVRSMIENLRYTALAHPAQTYEALRPAMALRESIMKRRVERILASLEPDSVFVLLGHAFHLAKDDRRIGRAGVGPGGDLETSLGHHVVQSLGVPTRAVWMLYGAGVDSQPFPDLPTRVAYPADSLNGRLAAYARLRADSGASPHAPAHAPLVVPIAPAANDALANEVGIGHLYNMVVPVHLPSEIDALFFVPTVSPLRAT